MAPVAAIHSRLRGLTGARQVPWDAEGALGIENIIDSSDGAVCLINLELLVCHHQFPLLVCPAIAHSEVGEETRTLFYCKPPHLIHAAEPTQDTYVLT